MESKPVKQSELVPPMSGGLKMLLKGKASTQKKKDAKKAKMMKKKPTKAKKELKDVKDVGPSPSPEECTTPPRVIYKTRTSDGTRAYLQEKSPSGKRRHIVAIEREENCVGPLTPPLFAVLDLGLVADDLARRR